MIASLGDCGLGISRLGRLGLGIACLGCWGLGIAYVQGVRGIMDILFRGWELGITCLEFREARGLGIAW